MTGRSFATVRLGDVTQGWPTPGTRQQKRAEGPPMPYVTTATVSGGRPALVEPPLDQTYGDVKGRITSDGDLLMVTRGVERYESVPCAVVRFEGEAAFSESLIRIRPEPSIVDVDYLRLYLTSRRGAAGLIAAASGGTISNIRKDSLREVEVELPDIQTQRAIAARMKAIEELLYESEETTSLMRDLYDTTREGFVAGILHPARRDS